MTQHVSADPNRFVALLGYGMWGRNLARNFDEIGALGAIVERTAEGRQRAVEERPGIPVVSTVGEAISLPSSPIRAFAVATPAETHAEQARRLLDDGFDVFVEKPLALHEEQGQALVDRAAQRERILMVGHLLLYHPAARALADLVRNGELGRLLHVYSNRLNWGKVRREENILWSFAPHDVALLLQLAGEEPTTVSAHGTASLHPTIADVTVSHLRFPSGLAAHIHVSWLHPFKEQRLVVVGDRRVAVFEDTAAAERKLMVYDHAIDWLGGVPVARKATGRAVSFGADEPLRLECAAFVEACRTRRPPITHGQSGVQVLRVLAGCQESMERGGAPVELSHPSALPEPRYFAHPTAVIGHGADIGEGTRVWHFSHVMAGAHVGARCVIGQNGFIASGVRIGDGCKIQNNVSLYDGVELGDDVFVGPSAVFTNVRHPRAHVERKDSYEVTRVGRGASFGANCTVRCGVTIGEFAVVGAGALVTHDVPAHAVVLGSPARVAGWACQCGESWAESQAAEPCHRCGAHWKLQDGALVSAREIAPR